MGRKAVVTPYFDPEGYMAEAGKGLTEDELKSGSSQSKRRSQVYARL